jgi:hypothetical protein
MAQRKTVRLDDGYNGHTVLLFADPIATDGQMVKLQCAEHGRGHLTRWAFRCVVDKRAKLTDICLCGAPSRDGVCSVPDCVCGVQS